MVYKLIDSTQAPLEGFNLQQAPKGLRSRQPFRTLWLLVVLADVFLINLPLRTMAYIIAPRLTRPHPKWSLLRSLFVSLLRLAGERKYALHSRDGYVRKSILPSVSPKDEATPIWIQPVNRQTGLEGDLKYYFEAGACITTRVIAYWFGENHEGEGGRRAAKDEKVILYFHGGGYYEQAAHPSSPTTNCLKVLLKGCSKSANKSAPKRALSVEYRLTDEATFPAIVADALAGWTHLVKQGFEPKNIIIAGDSAGGNLTLALTRYIRDYRPLHTELQIPFDDPVADGIILLSPWVDVSLSYYESGPASSGKRNATVDFLNETRLIRARNALVTGLPIPAVSSRWMSCLCTTRDIEEDLFDGFPRALVFGG